MSIESSIEARIRDAISRGEFDNLPGKGKRLDLDAYFATPEDMRMAFEMPKSNEFVPEEVEMLKEIARLKNALRECDSGPTADQGAGWNSYLKTEQDQLAVLRVDHTCSGGAWQAACVLYKFDKGEMARTGHCNLPPKLDAKALRASGWK